MVTGNILNPIFLSNFLFAFIIIFMFSYSILSRLLYSWTKYLHPILIENNKIIYKLELEIQISTLRDEN